MKAIKVLLIIMIGFVWMFPSIQLLYFIDQSETPAINDICLGFFTLMSWATFLLIAYNFSKWFDSKLKNQDDNEER